ncbi:MAG: hypothetical protein KA035_02850 [Candidatus Levybacteria bacterium]|nr:hypothetical protein [Candidatus Levybacteria bacterium]
MRKRFKTGIAFSDSIEERTFRFSGSKTNNPFFKRPDFLTIIPLIVLLCVFVILATRLFFVQVVQGAYYTRLADDNRTRTVVIPAPRGILFDRMKRPLVRNVPVFEVVKDGKPEIISKEQALQLISEDKNVFESVAREYLYKDAFSHVIGYTGHVSEDELLMPAFKGYAISDFVGKMGLEKFYESKLHGINGRELHEVNASGKEIRFLGKEEPKAGDNIITTLDLDIQLIAQKALGKVEKAAVVVSNPQNGEILALYSKPSFDPNLFTKDKEYKAIGEYESRESVLLDGEKFPLLDRAISGVYPPGSTFKLITSSAVLAEKTVTPGFIVNDTGVITVGGATFGTWNFLENGKTEGAVDLRKALQRSNDIYYYRVAEKLGIGKLEEYSKLFGLGKKTGIDLPGEVSGTVPGERWKKRTLGDIWYLGDTYNMSIGQGYLLTTPLQINVMTQIVANGGTYFKPHLVKGEESIIQKHIVDESILKTVREGMLQACETGGTGYPLFGFTVQNDRLDIDNLNYFEASSTSARLSSTDSAALKKDKYVEIKVGCKTGTAEAHGEGNPKPHASFTLFAPYHDPEVVVTVVVENGGQGSEVAGPIARDVLREYFERK